MKFKVLPCLIVIFACVATVVAQIPPTPTPTRERVIIVGSGSENNNNSSDKSNEPRKTVVVTNTLPALTPQATPRPAPTTKPSTSTGKMMSFAQIKSKIAEAKREMQNDTKQTALGDSFLVTDIIRIAFHNWNDGKLDYVSMLKTDFLSRNTDFSSVSRSGTPVTIRTIRGNGVNTPVIIMDDRNRAHLPLLVQYPREENGRLVEMAYYVSTHPGLVTPEIFNAGRFYLRNVIDTAREKLRQKGIFIQPKVADIAERLALVEHVDHQRFFNEYQPTIYNDVYTLFALNEGGTYRYAISSAGAGGVAQMIPATYRMVRSRYYQVGLMPDFIEGMRDHINAAQAMLLYMQMTWTDLLASPTIYAALETGIATQEDLMAAGYNSNPAKLPRYVSRGGANWRNLIPRETKIYLQIYASTEQYAPIEPRTK